MAAIASVLLVLVTIMLQGNFAGGQPYRVFWFWTYFPSQLGWVPDADGSIHFKTAPGKPFIWVLYLVVVCALGVVAAVYHDPELDRVRLRTIGLGLLGLALVLGVLDTTWRRSCGEASPGLRFAMAVVPATTTCALLRPFDRQLALFPYVTTTPSGWDHSATGWVALTVVAAAVLGVVLADARWWRVPLAVQGPRR